MSSSDREGLLESAAAAGLCEQAPGFRRVVADRLDRVPAGPGDGDRAGRDAPVAVPLDLAERLAVDAPGDRLVQELVVERRLVDPPLPAEPGAAVELQQLQVRVLADGGHVLRVDPVDQVELTRAEHRHAHRRVGHDAELDPVEVRLGRVPVARVALDRYPLALGPLNKLEGPGANRVAPEVGAQLLDRGRRDHEAGPVHQDGEQRGVGLAQIEFHGVAVDHLDALHDSNVVDPWRFRGRVLEPIDVPLDRRRIQNLAVVDHGLTQLKLPGGLIQVLP